MQRLKRQWASRSTVKKILMITVFCFMIGAVFLSVLPVFHFSSASGPTIVQQLYQQCNAFSCSVTLPSNVQIGNTIAVGITFTGDSSHAISAYACSDNLGNTYTEVIRSVDQANSLIVAFCIAPVVFAGSDTVSVSVTNPSGSTHTLLENAYEITGGSYASSSTLEGGGSSYTASCSGSDLCISGVASNNGGGAWAFTGTFDTVTCSCTSQQGIGHGAGTWSGITSVGYSEFALIDFGAGNVCQSFPVCVTNTYTITYSNETCVGAGCTATTTSTTISYDSTSTVVTYITCTGNHCSTRTITENKTVTTTLSTAIVVTLTTTRTVTNTAINAPSGFDLQFWLVPLIFLMGPAFGFMGGYGAVTQERGGTPNAKAALFLFVLGLNIGAIGGIILKVVPFPLLIVTMIPLALLIYEMR